HSLVEAAQDLGAGSFRVFTRVTFPMSLPGVFSGISMTFMPAVTTFIVSRLLGGGQNALIGDLIETQFNQSDWGFGSALSMVMMVLILIMMAFLSKYEKQTAEGGMLL
ncbi:MAG: ABC transporter permease subunit, partial [Clostridia bacterium]